MSRNLKVLGLALVAAMALSAVVASAASAQAFNFKSEASPTTLTGKRHGTNKEIFETDGGTVTCNEAIYHGQTNVTATSDINITPTYSNCTAFGFVSVPIDTEGCSYTFTTLTKEGSNFEGAMHILCPGGKSMRVTAPGCEVTIGEQTPTGGKITFTNLGSGATREITVDVALTGTHYIEDEIAGLPNCTSAGTTTSNGTYKGAWLVTGETPGTTTHTGVWVE